MNKTQCPYCGKKISYFTALSIRRRGEYFCKKCKKESNIHIKKTIWVYFIAAVIPALGMMIYYLFMTNRENLWFALFVAIPFIIFYLLTPVFVRLRPKKKFQDALYDTQMVEAPQPDPDPTMAKTAKVVPAFVDDIVLGNDYKTTIDSDVFNAIKEERKVVSDEQDGTKSFDKFENISSNANIGDTMAVDSLKDIQKIEEEKANNDGSYDLSLFE